MACTRRDDMIEAGCTQVSDADHGDPYVAAAQAFDALRRRIEDHVHRRRESGKARAENAPP